VHAVVCFIIYFLLGFFGAARWGLTTNTNLLVNTWGPSGYQGILNILLGIYLALTNPPLVYPIAHILRVSSGCTLAFTAHPIRLMWSSGLPGRYQQPVLAIT